MTNEATKYSDARIKAFQEIIALEERIMMHTVNVRQVDQTHTNELLAVAQKISEILPEPKDGTGSVSF